MLPRERTCIADHGTAQILREKIEIRSRILHQPKRPVRPVHEPLGTHRAQKVSEMILRRAPDPGEIPEHAPLFFGREPPVHLLRSAPGRRR